MSCPGVWENSQALICLFSVVLTSLSKQYSPNGNFVYMYIWNWPFRLRLFFHALLLIPSLRLQKVGHRVVYDTHVVHNISSSWTIVSHTGIRNCVGGKIKLASYLATKDFGMQWKWSSACPFTFTLPSVACGLLVIMSYWFVIISSWHSIIYNIFHETSHWYSNLSIMVKLMAIVCLITFYRYWFPSVEFQSCKRNC